MALTHTVYLAGPMSGYPDHNFALFDAQRDFLRSLGHSVLSPADLTRNSRLHYHRDGTSTEAQYATFIRNDVQALLLSTAIALLPGWVSSRGARFELAMAQMLGLTVLDAMTGMPLIVPVMTTAPDSSVQYRPLVAA